MSYVDLEDYDLDKYIKPIFNSIINSGIENSKIESIYFNTGINNYYQYLPSSLTSDKSFILRAINKGMVYYHDMPAHLQNKEFITKEVYTKMLSKNLINMNLNLYEQDIDVCMAAINGSPNNFRYLNEEFKANKNLIKLVIEKEPSLFNILAADMKDDRDLIKIVLNKDPSLFNLLNENIKKEIFEDIPLIIKLISQKPSFYWGLSDKLKHNKEILINMLETEAGFNNCKHEFRNIHDQELIIKSLKYGNAALKSLNQKYIMIVKKHQIKENYADFFKSYFASENLNNNIPSNTSTAPKMKL